jgi:hypothetical protein
VRLLNRKEDFEKVERNETEKAKLLATFFVAPKLFILLQVLAVAVDCVARHLIFLADISSLKTSTGSPDAR